MPGPLRESVIALVGGSWDRMVYYASDWEDTPRAAGNLGRRAGEFCGWPLAYRHEPPAALAGSGPPATIGRRRRLHLRPWTECRQSRACLPTGPPASTLCGRRLHPPVAPGRGLTTHLSVS